MVENRHPKIPSTGRAANYTKMIWSEEQKLYECTVQRILHSHTHMFLSAPRKGHNFMPDYMYEYVHVQYNHARASKLSGCEKNANLMSIVGCVISTEPRWWFCSPIGVSWDRATALFAVSAASYIGGLDRSWRAAESERAQVDECAPRRRALRDAEVAPDAREDAVARLQHHSSARAGRCARVRAAPQTSGHHMHCHSHL